MTRYTMQCDTTSKTMSHGEQYKMTLYTIKSKGFVTDLNYFTENILDQPLWGNKYITNNIGKTKSVLFLRNGIRSGIRTAGDLNFMNGILE